MNHGCSFMDRPSASPFRSSDRNVLPDQRKENILKLISYFTLQIAPYPVPLGAPEVDQDI